MAKQLIGKVVSLKTAKTVLVEIERYSAHPLYKKRVRRTKRFKVHYEGDKLKIGDTVEILQTRPMSKDKHYKVKI